MSEIWQIVYKTGKGAWKYRNFEAVISGWVFRVMMSENLNQKHW
jgi:hypothetical protein